MSDCKEFVVNVPKDSQATHSILKFPAQKKSFFSSSSKVKMQRENNLKQFKQAHDVDMAPKYGAGSEYGRDEKEEARKKKYGIMVKRYKPDDQPWLLKMGEGKEQKLYKGTREGGVSENTSYFVFFQRSPGSFEAVRVKDWYTFAPQARYKHLSIEEAEEEFNRRDKTINFFNIMLNKRLRGDEGSEELTAEEKAVKSSKARKSLLLTDMDDWVDFSDDEGKESDGDDDEKDKKDKKKDKNKKTAGKKKKKKKGNSDDESEGLEESDEQDEGREIDYMSDSDSEYEDMYEDKRGNEDDAKEEEKGKNYDDGGVAEEEGLRDLLSSGEDEEEEENKKKASEDAPAEVKEEKEKGSSSSSDSDSDPESLTSSLFLQKKGSKRARNAPDNGESSLEKAGGSTDAPAVKKIKTEDAATSKRQDEMLEESIKRYLTRRPMTTKEILIKMKSKLPNLSKEQLTTSVASLLKRINPEKKQINDKLHFLLKKS